MGDRARSAASRLFAACLAGLLACASPGVAAHAALATAVKPVIAPIGPVVRVPSVVPSLPASALATPQAAPALAAPSLAGQAAQILQGAASAAEPAALPAALDAVFDNAARPAEENAAAVEAGVAAAEPTALKPSGDFDAELWDGLAAWVSRELEIELPQGRARAWARSSRDTLREDPRAPFETVLAEAFSRVYAELGEDEMSRIRLLLEQGSVLLIPGAKTSWFEEHKGRVYAFTDQGLYLREGKAWRLLHPEIWHPSGFAEHGGALLVGDGDRIYELDGDKLSPLSGIEGRFFDIVRSPDGKTEYLTGLRDGSQYKVLRFDQAKGWETLDGITALNGMVELGGKVYAATNEGLFEVEGDRWTRALPWTDRVTDLAVHDGRLFFTRVPRYPSRHDTQAYELRPGQEPRRLFRWARRISLWTHAGRLYAHDKKGRLWERGDRRWSLLCQAARDDLFHIKFKEDLYVLRPDGFFVRRDGRWRAQQGGVRGYLGVMREFFGRRYLRNGDGVYENRGDEWSLVVPGDVTGFRVEEDGILFGVEGGTYRRVRPPAGLGADWRRAAMKDIGAAVSLAQARTVPETGYSATPEGDIEDEKGRSLFSGLRRLWAAMTSGFAGGQLLGAVWRQLDSWLSRSLGLEPAPEKIPSLETGVRDLLRNDSARSLDSVLAEAFGKARGLDSARWGLVQAVFGGEPVLEDAALAVLHFARSQGRTYALTEDGGVHVRKGHGWKDLDPTKNPLWRNFNTYVGEAFGRLFVRDDHGSVYEVKGEGFERVPSAHGKASVVFLSNMESGAAYLGFGSFEDGGFNGGRRELFKLDRWGSRRLPEPPSAPRCVEEHGGRLYVGTNDGIYRLDGETWAYVAMKGQGVSRLFSVRNGFFARDFENALFRIEGHDAIPIAKDLSVYGAFKNGDRLYVGERVDAGAPPVSLSGPLSVPLYEYRQGDWIKVRDMVPGSWNKHVGPDGLFIMTPEGMFKEKDGIWTRQDFPGRGDASFTRLVRSGGRRFGVMSDGAYEIVGETWRRLAAVDEAQDVLWTRGRLLVGARKGLYSISERPAALPRGWRRDLLAGMGADIRRAQQDDEPLSSGPNEDGDILGKAGEILFSGLRRGR